MMMRRTLIKRNFVVDEILRESGVRAVVEGHLLRNGGGQSQIPHQRLKGEIVLLALTLLHQNLHSHDHLIHWSDSHCTTVANLRFLTNG